MSTTMKSVIHLGLEYDEKIVRMPEPQPRSDQDVVQYLFAADCGKFIRNSESINDDA